MKKTLLICLSIIMIALVGCKKETNTWGLLKEGAVTVNVGDSVKLTFTNDGNKHPQWSSDNEFVAAVNYEGVVKGMHIGKCVVSVNGLKCNVEVTDKYEGLMYAPWEDWTSIQNDFTKNVIDYEETVRGTTIPEITYDTAFYYTTQERQDTIWNQQHTQYTIVVVLDTVATDTSLLPTRMVFDYTGAGLADRYVDQVIYDFYLTKKSGNPRWKVALKECAIIANSKHVNDMVPYLDARYAKSDDGSIHFYAVNSKKLCRIYVNTTTSGDTYVTWVGDK